MLKHSFSIPIAQFCTTFMSNQSGESLEQSGESHPTGSGLVSAEGVEAAMTEGAGGPWEGGMDQASVLVLQKEWLHFVCEPHTAVQPREGSCYVLLSCNQEKVPVSCNGAMLALHSSAFYREKPSHSDESRKSGSLKTHSS